MPRYRIEVTQTRKGFVEVDADTPRQAATKAHMVARNNANVVGDPWEAIDAHTGEVWEIDEGPNAQGEE